MKKEIKNIIAVNEDAVFTSASQAAMSGADWTNSPLPIANLVSKSTSAAATGTSKSLSYGGMTFNFNKYKIANSFNTGTAVGATDAAGAAGGAASNGLAWFGLHFKEIAIAGAAVGLLAGLVKLLKIANKSIKVRYNKVVKALQRAQKDFTLEPDGLNMKRIMPGVSGLHGIVTDFMARVFSGNIFNKKSANISKNMNIGLHPFCERYKEEISMDYKNAVDSYNKIIAAAKASKESNESVTEGSYRSFREAFASDKLNEGEINEAILTSMAIGLAGLGVSKLGQFVISKVNDKGKPEGEVKTVQATDESIREVCYAIIYNYMDKYVNMDAVFKNLGVDSKSLSDLDKASCEKLKALLKKYEKPEKNAYTKQYARMKSAYDTMLKHYYKIGDSIIGNFEKYTEAKDEKHANLLVSAKEKLQGMWDAQKDIYNNNFSHVLIEVVSSDAYVGYLNFIIESVMPVFQAGSAGDADYILDITPKKDQYYVIRQTEGQPWIEEDEKPNGNVAIAKVVSFDDKTKDIELDLVGLLKSDYTISGDSAEIPDDADIDYSAYKDDSDKNKVVKMSYGKFLSMDPLITIWNGKFESELFFRPSGKENEVEEYLYGTGSLENKSGDKEMYDTIIFASFNSKDLKNIAAKRIKLSTPVSKEDLAKYVGSSENNMNFKPLSDKDYDQYQLHMTKLLINSLKKDDESASGMDSVAEIVNKQSDKAVDMSVSQLYKRTVKKEGEGKEYDQYIMAIIAKDINAGIDVDEKQKLYDTMNEADENGGSIEVVGKDDDKADKFLVNKLFFVKIKAGERLESKLDTGFVGATIPLNTTCTLKDFCQVVEGENFEVVDDADDKIKKYLTGMVSDSKRFAIDNFSKETLDEVIKKVSESTPVSDNDMAEINKLTETIMSEMNKLNLDTKVENGAKYPKGFAPVEFKYHSDMSPIGKFIGLESLKDKGGFFQVQTNIKNKDDKPYPLCVYPALAKGKNGEFDLFVILVIGKYKQTTKVDKEGITVSLISINQMMKKGEELPDNAFQFLIKSEGGESSEGGAPNIDIEEFKSFLNSMISYKDGLFTKDADYVKGNFMLTSDNEGKSLTVYASNGPIDRDNVTHYVVKTTCTLNDKTLIVENNLNKSRAEAKPEDKNSIINAILQVNNLSEKPNDKQNIQGAKNDLTGPYTSDNSEVKDSVQVKYLVNKVISESQGSNVHMTRTFNRYMPKWYVLSESVFDDGCGRLTKLDIPSTLRRLHSKSDVMRYVKENLSAKISLFESEQNYTISSKNGYTPSIATPLYESVVLLKFDSDDNVIDKVYVGNNRIQ